MWMRKYDAFGLMLYMGLMKGSVTYVHTVNDLLIPLASRPGVSWPCRIFTAMPVLFLGIPLALGSSGPRPVSIA